MICQAEFAVEFARRSFRNATRAGFQTALPLGSRATESAGRNRRNRRRAVIGTTCSGHLSRAGHWTRIPASLWCESPNRSSLKRTISSRTGTGWPFQEFPTQVQDETCSKLASRSRNVEWHHACSAQGMQAHPHAGRSISRDWRIPHRSAGR